MTTLYLGVIDIPYAYDQEQVSKKGKVLKRKKKVVKSITTGDVAEILEDKYHVMEVFYEEHSQHGLIQAAIEESLAGALESLVRGAPVTADPFAAATQAIAEAFKVYVTSGAAERAGGPGVPTEAALKGVSHRKAHPYAKANPRRPSFVDTGMYVDHFKAWVD